MPRPPTPVGTWGEIRVYEVPAKKKTVFEASTYIRMPDGTSKEVTRRGETKTKATNRLKERLKILADEAKGGDITPETRFAKICDLYLEELVRDYKMKESHTDTPRLYRGYVNNWIKPMLGELQACEVLTGPCDKTIQKGRDKSYETAKSVRAVLSNVCDYAVRHGAMGVNPVRSTKRLTQGKKPEVKALTLEQRVDLLEKLEAFGQRKQTDSKGRKLGARGTVWLQLPDIMRAALATGVRLGELLALSGDDVDPAAKKVTIGHHIVWQTGVGLVRAPGRKGNDDSTLILGVPDWSIPMWRARKLASGGGALFPTWNGGWPNPSNIVNRIREAMHAEKVGYSWVTSHVWRKTVTSVLDEAGLPTTAIADQLGNTPAVVEKHYRQKRQTNHEAQAALQGMMSG